MTFFLMFLWALLACLFWRVACAAMVMRPDCRIGPADNPYLLRWFIIPRNRWFNIYLHCILRDDDDRALHDHPWWSLSIPLAGRLREEYHGPGWRVWSRDISQSWPTFRSATTAHRLILMKGPAWTLFITGPVLRNWGFWCLRPKYFDVTLERTMPITARFVRWQDFVDERDKGAIGRGCGEGEA